MRILLDGTSVVEVVNDKGVVVKALPGLASWEPVRKTDGTIDVAASKVEPVKETVVALEA